jgi:sec-independent protein translocase protein TatC
MTFLEHLEELRRVLIDAIVAVLIGMAASWAFSGRLIELLIARTMPAGTPIVFLGPGEAFAARVKVSLACGILATLPFILLRVWQFVVPGLLREERSLVLPIVVGGSFLFYLGGSFGFFVLTPIVSRILLAFSTPSMSPAIAVSELLGFILRLVLACGLVFQLPLVTTLLTVVGVVTPGRLWRLWRHAVVIIFVVAAIVTPGDGPSQLILAIPVTALYFLSVGLAFIVRGRRQRAHALEMNSVVPRDPDPAPEGDPPGSGVPPS